MTCEHSSLIVQTPVECGACERKSEPTEVMISVTSQAFYPQSQMWKQVVTHVKDRTLWHSSLCVRTDALSGFEAEGHPRNLGSPAGPGVIAKTQEKQTLSWVSAGKWIFLERTWAENERRWQQMGQSVMKPTANAQMYRAHASVWRQPAGGMIHSAPCNLGTEVRGCKFSAS